MLKLFNLVSEVQNKCFHNVRSSDEIQFLNSFYELTSTSM